MYRRTAAYKANVQRSIQPSYGSLLNLFFSQRLNKMSSVLSAWSGQARDVEKSHYINMFLFYLIMPKRAASIYIQYTYIHISTSKLWNICVRTSRLKRLVEPGSKFTYTMTENTYSSGSRYGSSLERFKGQFRNFAVLRIICNWAAWHHRDMMIIKIYIHLVWGCFFIAIFQQFIMDSELILTNRSFCNVILPNVFADGFRAFCRCCWIQSSHEVITSQINNNCLKQREQKKSKHGKVRRQQCVPWSLSCLCKRISHQCTDPWFQSLILYIL